MKKPLELSLALLVLLALPLHAAGIAVTGRVLAPDGRPAPGVRVLLAPVPPNLELAKLELAGKSGPAPAASGTTGADGSFRLTAPDVGMWTVRLEADGYAPLETVLDPLTEEAELADARLVPGTSLQVKVADPRGKPAANAWVRVEGPRTGSPARELWQIPLRRTFLTSADGSVTVPRRADEVLTVWAAAPGYLPARQEKVHGSSVSLRLMAGAPRRIEVRDAQGKPAAGVLVALADSSWPVGRTAEGGRLDLVAPAEGIDLRLAAEDGRRLDYRLRAGKPEEGPAVIALKAAAPASGKVAVDGTGRPIPGALVWPDRDPGAVARAGADGSFRLPSSGEDLRVFAAAPGYFGAQEKAAGGRVPTLKLQPRTSAGGIVVDEAGKPVAGAAVTARPAPGARGLRMAAWRSGGFTRSAATGRFKLSRLAAGVPYELRVQGEGFAPARAELPAREAGAAAPDLRIVLHPGRTAFGMVIDARRRPVASARVTLELSTPGDLEGRIREMTDPQRFPDAATDAAGRFEMKGLPAGTFDLTVRARGFAPLTVPALAVPGGKGRTDLGTVQLAPGATLRGVVSDPQGEPLADVEVRAKGEGRDEISRFLNDGEGGARAFTATDGSFVLEDLAPGVPLDLIATHPGYAPGAAPRVAVPAEAPVRIVLSPSSRVSGRVTGPDGKPVAGASVILDESARGFAGVIREMAGGPPHRGVTDDAGSFSFADVAPGLIGLAADAPRRQRQVLKGLEVKAGQDLTGVEIVLPAAAAVEGRVLLPDGHPAEGAEVVVAQAARGGAFAFPTLRANADDTGHYRIDGIAPGPHTLEAYADGYRRAVRDVDVKDETRGVDFQLDKVRGEVSGRVTDDAGSPVPGATVVLYGVQEDTHSGESGADGSFRITGVDDGSYKVRAGKPGYAPYRSDREVVVAGGPVGGLEVRLSAGDGAIVGRLTGLEFSQLARVRVWADAQINAGSVDADGNYRISHIPPGTWRVSAVVPDTPLHAEGRVTLDPGVSEARLDLQFGGGHELSGVVLRNGEPLAAAGLALARASGAAAQQTVTDHQGAFRFSGLEDGTYRLRVRTPNGAWHQETVEVTGDQTIQVDLRTVSLSGRVVDATDSSPVSGAAIFLKNPEGVRSGSFAGDATTDAHGVFHLPEVGEGSWTVQATREGYATAERAVQVEGDAAPGDLEIRLDPTEGVTVEALLATGQPPDRIRVAALDGAGHAVAAGVYPTGENGRTRVSNVPPGSWQLLVESIESAPVLVAAAVPGPAVRVVLPPAGQLRVQVPALAEHPAAATFVLTGPGGLYRAIAGDGSVRSEWELDDGTRSLDRVPAGTWQVTARAADGRSWSGTATVTPGGAAVVELR